MYTSNFYQKPFDHEVYIEELKTLASVHGLFDIYPFSNSFIEEFVCHELITFDDRKVNLEELLKAIFAILFEFEIVLKAFKKAIPKDSIKFDDYTNDVLYVVGFIQSSIFK